jgi:hypothetical protein
MGVEEKFIKYLNIGARGSKYDNKTTLIKILRPPVPAGPVRGPLVRKSDGRDSVRRYRRVP